MGNHQLQQAFLLLSSSRQFFLLLQCVIVLEVLANIIKVGNNKIADGSRELIIHFIRLVKLTYSAYLLSHHHHHHVGLGFLAPFSFKTMCFKHGWYIHSL